ncbi:unnamed protein product [Arctogadus glacialis]
MDDEDFKAGFVKSTVIHGCQGRLHGDFEVFLAECVLFHGAARTNGTLEDSASLYVIDGVCVWGLGAADPDQLWVRGHKEKDRHWFTVQGSPPADQRGFWTLH